MIHKHEQSTTQVVVWADGSISSDPFLFSELVGNTDEEKAQYLQDKIQDYIDVKVSLASLLEEDPDKTTDPARESLCWDGDNLRSRHTVCTVTWNNMYSIQYKNPAD